MRSKKVLLSSVAVIGIILAAGIIYLSIGIGVSTGNLIVSNVSCSKETIQIKGTTASSGEAFAGYDYSIKGDSIFIKMRYSIVNPIHKQGDFNITINDNTDRVNKVYLQGKKSEDVKLVWSR